MEVQLLDAASGVCGAVCCTYAGLPFDVAKVRLQSQLASETLRLAQQVPKYTGLVDCLAKIIREEGFLTLFKGAIPALSSAVSENAVGISVQHAVHRRLAQLYGDPEVRFTMATECLIGGCTGFFTGLAMCPFEVAKVRLQAARGSSLRSCMHLVMRESGLRGLYRGLGGLWARDVPFNAVFFGSYESMCTLMMWQGGHASKERLNSAQVFCAGGCAGAVGWSLVIPFDVVKTRLQAGQARGSVTDVMRSIVRREGVASLFSGWGAAVARAVPANAGLFLGVELSGRWFRKCFG